MINKHIIRFNESDENLSDVSYRLVWYPINGDVQPKENGQYLVTIWNKDVRVVTIGSYNRDPFSKKFEWSHGTRTIAFAELPNPYDN